MAAEAKAPLLTESPTISRTSSTEDLPTPQSSSSEAFPPETTKESPPVASSDPPSYSEIWTEALLENPAALSSAAEDIPTYAEVFPDTDLEAPLENSLPSETYGSKKSFSSLIGRIISPNSVQAKKIIVTATLMLAAQCMFSISMVNSGFLAVHLTGRNISGTVYGLVGSGVGIGFIIAPFLGIFNRLHYSRGISHHNILMGIMFCSTLQCLCYGVSDMIPSKLIFSAASIVLRIISGGNMYLGCITTVEAIRTWFPDNFQLVSSLVTGTASYVGYGTFSLIGAISYEDHGYHAPYVILGLFTLVAMVFSGLILPRNDLPISEFQSLEEKPVPEPEEEKDGRSDSLSPLVFLPIFGQYLINLASGYCVITSVIFLMECCDVSNSRASSLIFTNFLATAAGFLIAGFISQRRALSETTQAIIGCCLVFIGTLLLFPSPSLPLLYTSTHFTGYFSISLLGLGDPLVTNVTISNMERIQTVLCGRRLTAQQKSSLASIWLIGWVGGVNSGMFLAGIFLDHLTFLQGACVVAGLCVLAAFIFGILKLAFVMALRRTAEQVEPALSVSSCEIEYV